MKKLKAWRFELRLWQQKACKLAKERYENNDKDFLCVATPGAGKTIFALRMVHFLLRHKMVERVVILCPTEHLKKQWALSAARFGIDIDPNFENGMIRETSDYFGVAVTYAQVGRSPEVHARNTKARKTLAVFDEIHHLGDDLTWGDSVREAFEDSAYRLAISGTPFRRDSNPIPFINYISSESKADYTYGYKDALVDKVCRPVYFPAYDGKMTWRVHDKVTTATFADEIPKDQESERLRTALDPAGEWLETVIVDANNRLDKIRRTGHDDAGGLIITIDQTHAKKVAEKVYQLTRCKPVVVVSEDPKASKKIKEFSDAKEKWIIAVKMISEGVDIPRLRVGIFATNVKSELFFRQAVGRFVRTMKEIGEQRAYFFIPKDAVLVYYARQIEAERQHSLEVTEIEEEEMPDLFDSTDEDDEKPRDEKFEAISALALGVFQYEMDFGDDYNPGQQVEMFGQPSKTEPPKEEAAEWIVEDDEEEDIPLFELASRLKEDIKEIARHVAIKKQKGRANVDWDAPHREWIQMGGKPIDSESIDELRNRRKWLVKQLSARGQQNIF